MATEQHDEDPLKEEKDWVQKQEEWILAMSNDPKEEKDTKDKAEEAKKNRKEDNDDEDSGPSTKRSKLA